MFFQNKSAQGQSKDFLELEPLNASADIMAESDEKVPPFYQKENIFDQGAQRIAAISQNSVFTGNLETQDNLAIFGRLIGNVTGAASVRVCGAVKGDLHCEALQSTQGIIEGDAFVAGDVQLSKNSRMTGNLRCDHAELSGTMIGDIQAVHGIVLTESAVLNGNLCACEIEIHKGAKFNGAIKTESSSAQSQLLQENSPQDSTDPEPEALPIV